jgi:nucleoside-diphosphate-sugar epimerase
MTETEHTLKVFVAGATGVIGRRAVARLVEAGHEVTAVARSEKKAEGVRALGATPVQVSLFDRDALAAAVAGHDAVLNLATKIPSMSHAARPGAWDENNRIRSEGSANLVDAALAAGASRYVQESITFTYPDSGDAWIDAGSTAIDPPPLGASVAEAEANAARFTAAGGTGVVLRFGMFYAADASHTQAMVAAARRGISVVAGGPDAYQSMIHADDAASAVVAALTVPAGTYDVVDDEPLTKREVARAMGGRVRVPGTLAKMAGSQADIMMRSQRVSNRRFKEATGWSPRYPSLRDGIGPVAAEVGAADRRPLLERLVRPVLLVLALGALQVGLWLVVSPRSFYDDFPGFGRHWVSVDGPFNEHAFRDFGQSQLALAAVLLAAFLRPQPYLVRTAALAYLLFAVPHLAYHAAHLDVYETGDQVANMILLGTSVALAAVLVLGSATTGRYGRPTWERSGSSSLPSSEPSPV